MTVTLVEQLGHELLVTGTVADRRVVVRQAAHTAVPLIGSIVRLVADADERHRFDPVTDKRIDV